MNKIYFLSFALTIEFYTKLYLDFIYLSVGQLLLVMFALWIVLKKFCSLNTEMVIMQKIFFFGAFSGFYFS